MELTFYHLYRLSMLAGAGVFALVGLLVLRSRNKSAHARLWMATSLLAAVTWTLMHLVIGLIRSKPAALVLSRIAFATGPASCLAFFCFGLAFLGKLRAWRRVVQASVAAAGLLGLLASFTHLLFTDLGDYGHGLRFPVAGPLMPFYAAAELVWLTCPAFLFVRAWRRERGRKRLQLGYLSVALICMAVGGVGSLVPTVGRESILALLPMFVVTLGPALITYAIIRHQLWDIRTVAHKTALWAGTSLLTLVPVYLGLRQVASTVSHAPDQVALGLAVVLYALFGVHFRVVQPWINHRFARGSRDLQKVVDRFNREVQNKRSVGGLSQLLVATLRSALYPESVRLVVMERDTDSKLDAELQQLLIKMDREIDSSVLEHYELEPDLEAKLAAFLYAEKVAVLVPLVDEGKLLGMVFLGEKANFRAYTRDDFQLLERVRPLATIALANALLYDQLQELNVSLEQRVEQRTRELSEANQKLLELDRMKTKFFANVTHELHTPLALILAPLEDLLMKAPGGSAAEDLATMHRNALRLLRHINALLDLSKVDAGELRLKPALMHLNQFAEAAVQRFRPIARHKNISLSFSPLDGNDTVWADGEKLDLVLGNLLANAVKFTEAGGSVEVRVLGEESWLSVAVKDTGIGIPDAELERIFDRFAQVDSGPTRRYEGAGIGLSLVKEIVTLHRGSLAVSSRLGQGSQFRVRLPPYAPARHDEAPAQQTVELPSLDSRSVKSGKRGASASFDMQGEAWVSIQHGSSGPAGEGSAEVLVVEDNPDMRSYLQRRLAEHFRVSACSTGREALQRVAERGPDIIISDVMMPAVSGVELCQRLKQNPVSAAIPIILITARTGLERTLEGFGSGADDYLTKPFNFHELLARIRVQLRLAELGRRLARQEKGAVLNLVAAGLAHEVRNPINAIINATGPLAELLRASLSSDAWNTSAELLDAIKESALRIERLISDVLGVSRPDVDEMADWSVPDAVESTLRLLRCRHHQTISVQRSFGHRQSVFGRTSQLNQVLLNLLDNAVRAAGAGGTIWVTTEQTDGTFRLRVRDSGPGVAKELRERIFDPLFTTRAAQGSTGLGLWVTRRIVNEHHGQITCQSPAAGGAEFIVELPLEVTGSRQAAASQATR